MIIFISVFILLIFADVIYMGCLKFKEKSLSKLLNETLDLFKIETAMENNCVEVRYSNEFEKKLIELRPILIRVNNHITNYIMFFFFILLSIFLINLYILTNTSFFNENYSLSYMIVGGVLLVLSSIQGTVSTCGFQNKMKIFMNLIEEKSEEKFFLNYLFTKSTLLDDNHKNQLIIEDLVDINLDGKIYAVVQLDNECNVLKNEKTFVSNLYIRTSNLSKTYEILTSFALNNQEVVLIREADYSDREKNTDLVKELLPN